MSLHVIYSCIMNEYRTTNVMKKRKKNNIVAQNLKIKSFQLVLRLWHTLSTNKKHYIICLKGSMFCLISFVIQLFATLCSLTHK